MLYVTRRYILRSGLSLAGQLTLTAIVPSAAEAFNFGDVFGGVGAALVPALNNVTQDIFQAGVSTAAGAAGSAVGSQAPGGDVISSLTTSCLGFLQSSLQQALPIFCNPNPSQVPLNLFADMSDKALQLGSSDEDQLLGDPSAYISGNLDIIGGYVQKYGGGQNSISLPFSIPPANDTDTGTSPSFHPGNVPMQYQPSNSGYYPCGMTSPNTGFNDQSILSLISLAMQVLPAITG